METTRIAVMGVYRSGSTAVAGALHHLGVDMGPPFFEGFYESAWLSQQLRRWWDEPRLREKVKPARRVEVLAHWIRERERGGARWVGMKHPLLSLCGPDLVQAWGEEARFIRCCRPLPDSIESLKYLGAKVDGAFLQGTLFAALESFFAGRPHLQVEFADMMNHPRREIERLAAYLGLSPRAAETDAAVSFITPGRRAKVESERRGAPPAAKPSKPRALLTALRRAISR